MGERQGLVLVDTNVFVIELRYRRDINYKSNLAFLTHIAEKGTGFTTIVNLLELCGILSFNLNEKQLLELWFYFEGRYKITVLPPAKLESDFPRIGIKGLFDNIKSRASLGDALMITVARKYLPFVSTMVTWDTEHFEGRFRGAVLTPAEYLAQRAEQ